MYYIKNVYNFKERPKNALIYNNYQNSFYQKLKQGILQKYVWIYQYKFLIQKDRLYYISKKSCSVSLEIKRYRFSPQICFGIKENNGLNRS